MQVRIDDRKTLACLHWLPLRLRKTTTNLVFPVWITHDLVQQELTSFAFVFKSQRIFVPELRNGASKKFVKKHLETRGNRYSCSAWRSLNSPIIQPLLYFYRRMVQLHWRAHKQLYRDCRCHYSRRSQQYSKTQTFTMQSCIFPIYIQNSASFTEEFTRRCLEE